jgi:hypothetical protein
MEGTMRIGFGILAAALLAALSQPALAVCVYRGLATMCYKDSKDSRYEKDPGGSTTLTLDNADRPADAPSEL